MLVKPSQKKLTLMLPATGHQESTSGRAVAATRGCRRITSQIYSRRCQTGALPSPVNNDTDYDCQTASQRIRTPV